MVIKTYSHESGNFKVDVREISCNESDEKNTTVFVHYHSNIILIDHVEETQAKNLRELSEFSGISLGECHLLRYLVSRLKGGI